MDKKEQIELAEFLDELLGYMSEENCDMGEAGSQFMTEIRGWITKLNPPLE